MLLIPLLLGGTVIGLLLASRNTTRPGPGEDIPIGPPQGGNLPPTPPIQTVPPGTQVPPPPVVEPPRRFGNDYSANVQAYRQRIQTAPEQIDPAALRSLINTLRIRGQNDGANLLERDLLFVEEMRLPGPPPNVLTLLEGNSNLDSLLEPAFTTAITSIANVIQPVPPLERLAAWAIRAPRQQRLGRVKRGLAGLLALATTDAPPQNSPRFTGVPVRLPVIDPERLHFASTEYRTQGMGLEADFLERLAGAIRAVRAAPAATVSGYGWGWRNPPGYYR